MFSVNNSNNNTITRTIEKLDKHLRNSIALNCTHRDDRPLRERENARGEFSQYIRSAIKHIFDGIGLRSEDLLNANC